MKFSTIILRVNTHRLTESDSRLDVTLFKMAAITSLHAEKCYHLVSEHEVSAACLCSSVHAYISLFDV